MKIAKKFANGVLKGLVAVHCFDYFQFFKSTKTKIVISVMFLFIPPIIFVGLWCYLEYEEIKPFQDIVVIGPTITLANDEQANLIFEQTKMLSETLYNFQQSLPGTKGTLTKLVENGQKEREASLNFKGEISKKFVENLGVFSSLPYYRVCLVNRNTIKIGEETVAKPKPPAGAASIKQIGGYEFYALPGNDDCKNVVISVFKNSTSTLDSSYQLPSYFISDEENMKREKVEPYTIISATTSLITSNTKVTISLTGWIVFIAYSLTLLAWSLIFFQVAKILDFFAKLLDRKNGR